MKKKTHSPAPLRLSMPVKRFVESVGQFIHYWGFMRLQGEIWALAFLSRQPLTAMEIAKLLGVSKASVSLALKELLDYRVIFLDTGSGKRNLPLVANENLKEVITGVIELREQQMIQQTRSGLNAIRTAPRGGLELDDDRLKKIEELIEGAEALLKTVTMMTR